MGPTSCLAALPRYKGKTSVEERAQRVKQNKSMRVDDPVHFAYLGPRRTYAFG